MNHDIAEKLFWNDWFANPEIAVLPPASRCVMMEIIGRMTQRKTKLIQCDIQALSRLVRAPEAEIVRALRDIESEKLLIVQKQGSTLTICAPELRIASTEQTDGK